jgi:hypothetical protein
VTVIKTTITVTGKCADFDAAAAAQALATDLGVSVGQITVTTRCDGRRRRLLKVEAFAVDVEIVAESDAAVSQLVGSLEEAAAEVDFGEDFAVAAVAPPVTSTKAVGGPSPPPSASPSPPPLAPPKVLGSDDVEMDVVVSALSEEAKDELPTEVVLGAIGGAVGVLIAAAAACKLVKKRRVAEGKTAAASGKFARGLRADDHGMAVGKTPTTDMAVV